jgi:hypothetical protein
MNGDLEGSGCSLIEVLSQHLPGRTEENHEILSNDNRYSDRDSKGARPEYDPRALLMHQPVW